MAGHRRSPGVLRHQLAAEVIPRVFPVDRGHDLLMPLAARRLARHDGPDAGTSAEQMRLAGLFEEYSDAHRVWHRRAAKRHAMIAHQHREGLTKRRGEGQSLVLSRYQRHVVLVARDLDEVVGIECEWLQ